ncbi:type IV secretory system conjugative DNA transfer family protein [Candidatus Parcubacteria bacterium]|nr:MAG: type IV secretory system conjugative DNA transfer family protein [Candidatus Parcubacteria bacterium]
MSSLAILGYGTVLAVAVASGAAWWAVRRVRSQDELARSLNLALLHVSLPRPDPNVQRSAEELRQDIGLMETVFSGLSNIRDSWWSTLWHGAPNFALELTVPHVGEELWFYAAVPRRFAAAVEKIIHGVYPDARIEKTNDYNIFHPTGESAVALVTLARSTILPIRTYRRAEGDPLREVANAFSKLASTGEGAALQIVARPAPSFWTERILSHAKLAFAGKAPIIPKSALAGELAALAGATTQKKDGQPEKEHRLSPQEEEAIRLIETKGSRPLFLANIRIVAAAPTQERADAIASDISAAFRQYAEPALNEFSIRPQTGSNRAKALYHYSFRLFHPRSAIVLSAEELSSIYHFPNAVLGTPKVRAVRAREAALPMNLGTAGVMLGTNIFRGETRDVRMDPDDRRRHLYIIGQTGTGKTSLMTEMIRQDVLAGHGVCFIDPHGESVERVLGYIPPARLGDVIYFNPADVERPFGLNLLEYDPRFPEQKTFVVNELFSIFQKLYGAVPEAMGPMFEQYFRNATLLVLDDPESGNTLLEVERVFVDKAFRALKLERSHNVVVQTFWREMAEKAGGDAALANMAPYITSKFDTFLANEIMRPIIAQQHSAFDFRAVMDKKQILLVNLSKGRLGELNSSLIGLILVGKLLMAALARTDAPESERPDFYCYLDEFQNVTTPSIATILSEARKYRLNLILAHQFLGQLDEKIKTAVFGNVGSLAAFRVGAEDGEFLATQFQPVFSAHDLINTDNHHACVKLLAHGQTALAFSMHTSPPAAPDPAQAEAAKNFSRATYGRPKADVEQEIRARYNSVN